LNIGKKQAIAIGMEIGIHNGTMAIFIATTVLNNSVMSIPPAIYSLIMFITAGLFGYLVNNKIDIK
jgi:BASS family bile acid:Na+ symporter